MTASAASAARAARESVLVVSAQDRSAILVTGKDRTGWLNGLVTCELLKLMPGQGIDWKGDWEAARKEAAARNVPIMFTVHKDN